MISIVAPFFNERESVRELHARIFRVMKNYGKPFDPAPFVDNKKLRHAQSTKGAGFEIIFVDDGSKDGTFAEIKKLSPVRAFRLSRNFGQTAAFGCGIMNAKGEVIVTLDGDLENYPEDIPRLLKKLGEGYDVVSGWRGNRWSGQFITRRLPSLLANLLISKITGIRLHDHGCNLRAYRREVFKSIPFNGEMHRMLAAYLGMHGARVAEIPVSYAPRPYGKSKYGLSRTFKVILDILAFYFFREFSSRPMHFFGYAGFVSIFLGFLIFLGALYLRLFQGLHFNRTPLPELVAIFTVVGFQFILMGLLAEILVRSRNSSMSSGTAPYTIREEFQSRKPRP